MQTRIPESGDTSTGKARHSVASQHCIVTMAGIAVDGSPWVTGLQASGVGEHHAHDACAAMLLETIPAYAVCWFAS
jgi:hypothetical protein